MNTEFEPETKRLSDRELLERVQRLARCEFHVIGRLMVHLTEMERRRLYLRGLLLALRVLPVIS